MLFLNHCDVVNNELDFAAVSSAILSYFGMNTMNWKNYSSSTIVVVSTIF